MSKSKCFGPYGQITCISRVQNLPSSNSTSKSFWRLVVFRLDDWIKYSKKNLGMILGWKSHAQGWQFLEACIAALLEAEVILLQMFKVY
jgi:hypothetical protein